MINRDQLNVLAEEAISETNYYIVDLTISKSNQIRLEIDGDRGVNIQDCVNISRHIESNLDREQEDFELTVSSAGMDQPFKILRQYQRYLNRQVVVKTKEGEQWKGILNSADENEVVLAIKKKVKEEGKKKKIEIIENISVPMDQVKETKAVISFN